MRVAIVVVAALLVCALGVVGYTATQRLIAETPSAASVARQDASMPTPLIYNTAPPVTLAPAPPPTPSYNYVWDPNNSNQCFNPSDPNLPPNAPRCPPRSVPSNPGGPIVICPTGYVAVVINGQVQCAKKAN